MRRLDVLPFLKHRVVDVELLFLGVGPAAADVTLDTLLKLRTGTLLHKEHGARKHRSDQLTNAHRGAYLPSSPGHSQILLAAVEKNREKAWDQNYVIDR